MTDLLEPYSISKGKSHIEVAIHPPLIDGTWSDIETLGNLVITEIEGRKRTDCLVDLSSLNYMGSSVVALLVRIWKVVRAQNGQLVIVTDHTIVKETISLAGLDKIWAVYPHINGACRAIGAPLHPVEDGAHSGIHAPKKSLVIGAIVLVLAIIGVSFLIMNQQP